jgi:hypothetical protein
LEAHRSGLSVHRIAQIFRERGVDISVPHLVRTVRRFVDEEERVAGRSPLRTVQRVPRQRNDRRNPLPKQRSQRPRSRTRLLNNLAPESRRRNLRSNCGSRATWLRQARRRPVHWSQLLRQERRNRSDPLQRRGLKPKRERWLRKLGRKNWRKRDGGRDGRVTKCHRPVRGEGRSSGRGRGVDKLAAKCFRALADAPQLKNPS